MMAKIDWGAFLLSLLDWPYLVAAVGMFALLMLASRYEKAVQKFIVSYKGLAAVVVLFGGGLLFGWSRNLHNLFPGFMWFLFSMGLFCMAAIIASMWIKRIISKKEHDGN